MSISSIYDYSLDRTPFQVNGWEITDQLAPDALGLKDGGFAVAYSNANLNKGFSVSR